MLSLSHLGRVANMNVNVNVIEGVLRLSLNWLHTSTVTSSLGRTRSEMSESFAAVGALVDLECLAVSCGQVSPKNGSTRW